MQQGTNKKISNGYDKFFRGDKILWTIIIAFSLVSVFFVFSASTNLEYVVNSGTTLGHTLKHAMFIVGGLAIMSFIANVIKYEYIGVLSRSLLFLSVVLLMVAAFTGQEIDGASASRWISIGGFTIQPSTFTYLMLIIYICRYLAKNVERERLPTENIVYLFAPILLVFGLVFKDNGSTAVIILLVSLLVMLIGQFPLKYIWGFVGVSGVAILVFLFITFNTDWIKSNRVHTWKSRIEVYLNSDQIEDEVMKAKNYQIDRAKAAIVHGGIQGVGPGKSALKQSLPQSASDFIFAIIVEEYGLWGAAVLFFGYVMMLVRISIIASKTASFFGTLLVLSIGVMLFVQLATNIAVAIGIIPVTGQPLPLISYGGTSMIVTYMQLGIVLNVSSRIQMLDEEGIGKKQSIQEINDIA